MRAIFHLASIALELYQLGLLIYIVCSWIRIPLTLKIELVLARAYEPLLQPIRRRLPMLTAGRNAIDFSPIVLLVCIWILGGILRRLLRV